MMQHLHAQKQQHRPGPPDGKGDNPSYLPPGMMYSPGNPGPPHKTESGETGKNLSMGASNDVMNLGQPDGDEKLHLLQKMRGGQTPVGGSLTCLNNGQGEGNYTQYKPYPAGPPSMVPIQSSTGADFNPPPKKKRKKKPKPPTSPVPMGPVSESDDLLKSSMCSLCQATFMRFTDLLAHHKSVHNSDTNHPLRCRACGRTQTSEAGLIYHQVYVCKMVERLHQCQVCGLKFQSEGVVLVHKCSGDPRKKYACEFCDHYRTESSSDLEKHMRIHTNDKCYVCKICGFSTAWKKNLKEHMVKHLGLKPYVCDMCGYSTGDRHNLRSHRLKHFQRGEGCPKCGQGECHCQIKMEHNMNSSPKKKKSSNPSNGNASPGSASTAAQPPISQEKELECPYPNCVYRTKLDFMMSNHILRHQGGSMIEGSQQSQHQAESDKNGQDNPQQKQSQPQQQFSDASQFLGSSRQQQGHQQQQSHQQQQQQSHQRESMIQQSHQRESLAQHQQQQRESAADLSCSSAASSSQSNAIQSQSVSATSNSMSQSQPVSLAQSKSVSSLSLHQSMVQQSMGSKTLVPLPDWKTLSHQAQVGTTVMLSPPAQFQPLVQQPVSVTQFTPAHCSAATPHEVTAAALSSWPTAAALTMSHPVVPTALLSNQVAMQIQSGQNMVPRHAMPVFPNMPN